MRRTVVRKGVNLNKAMPDEGQTKQQRNVNADKVGKDKAYEEKLAKRRKKK